MHPGVVTRIDGVRPASDGSQPLAGATPTVAVLLAVTAYSATQGDLWVSAMGGWPGILTFDTGRLTSVAGFALAVSGEVAEVCIVRDPDTLRMIAPLLI
jgi:hypothetical protein